MDDGGGRRLSPAERFAVRLGTLVEEIYDEARQLPRWRPAPIRRRVVIRLLNSALRTFHDWCEAFDIDTGS